MKLLKCYVSSFGKLKDFSHEFDVGLNTIKQDNGWGKSTLASFIKSIFYGLNDSKRNVAENERQKFKPWNSTEKFGGYVDFEWGGKEYRIERFFGNKESEDTIKLIDIRTGKSFANTENLGKRIFEIDEEGFLSTTYLSQRDFQVKGNSSITAKFNSVCEVQDSESFDKAVTMLEEKAKSYKYRGDKGLISDTKREIFAINEKVEQVEVSVKTVKEKQKLLTEISNDLAILKTRSDELTTKLSEVGKREALIVKKQRYQELNEQKEKLVKQKEGYDNFFGGYLPSKKEIQAYAECNNELINISAKENVLYNDVQTLKNIAKQKSTEKKTSYMSLVSFSVSALLFVVSFIITIIRGLSFMKTAPSIIINVLFVMCLVVGIIVWKKEGSKPTDISENAILEHKKKELLEYRDIKQNYELKIDKFLSKFNFGAYNDRNSALNILYKTVDSHAECVLQISEVDKQLSDYEYDKALFERLSSDVVGSMAELKAELSAVQNSYTSKSNEYASVNSSIKKHQEFSDSLPDLEAKKTELVSRLEQYNEDYNILLKTIEFLKLADENLKVRYREPLQKSLNKYFSMINGGDKKVDIDVNMCVTVQENGSQKVTDFYSKGYQNLFEICKRFALTDVLFTAEKPFMILDDPFYNLDDEKVCASLSLIKKLAEEYQIIYFVCHESRRA